MMLKSFFPVSNKAMKSRLSLPENGRLLTVFFARQEPNAQGPKNSPPKCWPDRNPRITPENLSPQPSPPHPTAPARPPPPPPTLRDSPHSSGSCIGKSGPFLFSQPTLPLPPPPPPHSGHPESATHHWPLLLAATV